MKQRLLDEKSFLKRLKLYFSYFDKIIADFIGMIVAIFVMSFFSNNINPKAYIYLIIFFYAFFTYAIITVEVEFKHKQFNSSDTNKQFFELILYSILFIGLTLTYSYSQVESVRDKKNTYGTTITLDDNKVLFSDSSNYFIGKTKDYIFYYHATTRTTDIIPVSKLKQLTSHVMEK